MKGRIEFQDPTKVSGSIRITKGDQTADLELMIEGMVVRRRRRRARRDHLIDWMWGEEGTIRDLKGLEDPEIAWSIGD
jgi:hypothetical protein